METEWSVDADSLDSVSLVTVVARNPSSVDRRVEVSNRLDGPVLPPRRAGVPEPGWSRDGFAGVVPADGRRVLGYACPAPPATPPVAVVDGGRATDGVDADGVDVAVRQLGDPRPPIDALPAIGDDGSAPGEGSDVESDDERPPSDPVTGTATDRETGSATTGDATDESTAPAVEGVPPSVASWLATVEERVERGERLTDASVSTATTVLEGEGEVSTLDDGLDADAAALRWVVDRAEGLAERAGAVEVPVEALRRLA